MDVNCRVSSCSAGRSPSSPCTGDIEVKGSEIDDRKAQNINWSISDCQRWPFQAFATSSIAQEKD